MNLKDYIRGERHGKGANRLEREAMEDPFLQGAIDGYDSVEGDHYSVIQKLERQLTQPRKRVNRRVWIAAAAALLLLLIGIPFLLHPPRPTDEPLVATTDTRVEKEIVTERTLGEETLKKGTLEEETVEEKVAEERTVEEEAAPLEEIVLAQATEDSKELKTIKATGTTGITGITETTKMAEEHKVLEMAQVMEAKTVETTEAEETAGSTRTTKASDERTKETVEVAQLKQYEVTVQEDKEEQLAEAQASSEGKQGHLRVSGRLLDEKGEPVVGATVLVENSKSGVVTGTDGKFSLSVPKDEKRPLIATFVGMHNETIPLKEEVGDITMKKNEMVEYVVLAFASPKKEKMVGSTTTAKQDSSRTDDKALDQRGKEETDQFKVDEATTVAFGKKKAEAKASRGIKSITKESGEKDTEAVAFGEKEFKEYFLMYYDKSLCQGDSIAFTVTFSIRSDGRPTGIQIQENSCPDLETEIKRLLLGSPLWTNTNRKVTLTVEIPGS